MRLDNGMGYEHTQTERRRGRLPLIFAGSSRQRVENGGDQVRRNYIAGIMNGKGDRLCFPGDGHIDRSTFAPMLDSVGDEAGDHLPYADIVPFAHEVARSFNLYRRLRTGQADFVDNLPGNI